MNNKKDRMDLNNTFRNTQRNINNKKYICLYAGCSNKAIFSHSQQKSRSLKSISKNGQVYALNSDLGHSYDFKTDNYELSFKLIGIGKASIFSGFCSKHENIFKTFEEEGLDIENNDHISRLHYRTLMYNYSQTRKEIERLKSDMPQAIKTFKNIDSESFLNKRLKELEIHSLNIKNQADKVISHIENNDKDFLSSISFEIKRNIGISCSNSSIFNDDNPDGNNPTFSFNILPDIDSTVVVMSWLRVHDSHAGRFVGLLNEDAELFINLHAFYLMEDICINPDLWDSNNKIQNVVKETRHLSDPLFYENVGIKKVLKIPELLSFKIEK